MQPHEVGPSLVSWNITRQIKRTAVTYGDLAEIRSQQMSR